MDGVHVVLGYWAIRGLAQPIRNLLKYGNVSFEDKLYTQGGAPDFSREEWFSEKGNLGLDFPNLPYAIVKEGDKVLFKMTQSKAILRYFARRLGLVGNTEEEQRICDFIAEEVADFQMGFVRLCYGPNYEENSAKYLAVAKERLDRFEAFLTRDWVAGTITYADFLLYEVLDHHRIWNESILSGYPRLSAFVERFEALPAIQEYRSSPSYIQRPLNNTVANFK
eukprot:GILI01007841.1.p1 GENE.GILI01007841.1~~GILI01007841.1.p1  ORF type:complete len:223 (+),score=70.87 GILI01007841.1:40-708(+)